MAVLPLDQHLCFALYSASRAMTAAYRPILAELNLTYPQYLVLLALWDAEGDVEGRTTGDVEGGAEGDAEGDADAGRKGEVAARVTVGQLGERLHLDSGTLSPLLKRLEANGFVHRERSRTDERLVDVTLTAAGRRLGQQAQCIPERLLPSTGMTERDAADLRDAVRQLTDALNASLGRDTR